MAADTFVVDVPGVGAFECRRRNMRTALRITAEYNRLTEGDSNPPEQFAGICNFLAYLKVMVIEGPEGWDVDETDPDSDEEIATLREVFSAIAAEEARFRGSRKGKPQKAGEGAE